jgi:hypothetical protein
VGRLKHFMTEIGLQESMSNDRSRDLVRKIFLLTAFLGIVLSGCTPQPAQGSRLRVTNNGSIAIHDLVVRFSQDRIEFGDVPAGRTTDYEEVPNGVLAYAAYEFEVDGEVITQPVMDWVGESPMSGILFTYTIDFDPNRADTVEGIRLIDVKNDD